MNCSYRWPVLIFMLWLTATVSGRGWADSVSDQAAPTAVRQDVRWDTGWRFLDDDAAPNADVSGWAAVELPHTWDATGYRRGAGWYAKSFVAPANWGGHRVFLQFEAVGLSADVYLNGTLLGRHEGGFTAFTFELTSGLKLGVANEIRVRADNSKQPFAPLGGDFNMNGGIYRPVHLILTGPLCISPLDHGSSGVLVSEANVSTNEAWVLVQTEVADGGPAVRAAVEIRVLDAKGQPVCSEFQRADLAAGGTGETNTRVPILHPRLWQGRLDPYLYQLDVRLWVGTELVDEVRNNIGLRTVTFSPDGEFLLNGKPYPIHGVDKHQDFYEKGWAASDADQLADLAMIEDMGATAIRLAHYPQSRTLLDACDRDGILLWQEIPQVNHVLPTPEFLENSRQQLTEEILQDENHPSLMVWGLFNEVAAGKGEHPEDVMTNLRDLAHQLDPNRVTVGASCYPKLTALNHAPDELGFNIYPGWYRANPDGFTAEIGQLSEGMDGRRIALSEYGAGASVDQHQEAPLNQPKPNSRWHPEEWQTYLHERAWAQIVDNPHLWGSFAWVMFDFPSAGRHEGDTDGFNDKGLVTYDRKTRKDAYYFYRANWNPEPMVYIAERRLTPRLVPLVTIQVFSNCPAVELRLNGVSLGAGVPDKIRVASWSNVKLALGPNRVEAIAHVNGKVLSDSCQWVLEPLVETTPVVPELVMPAAAATIPQAAAQKTP